MKIVAVGDSITRGLNASIGGLECQSYAHWIAEVAGGEAVIHAQAGAPSARILDLAREHLDGGSYDVAFVFVGVNDALASAWNPDLLETSLRALLSAAREAAPRVITMTIPPWVGKMLIPRGRIHAANAIIRDVAAATGAEVVDLSPVTGPPAAWADYIHPTSLGQVAIADLIAAHMGLPLPSADLPPARLGVRFWCWYRYRQARYWCAQSLTRLARAANLR